MERDGSDVFEIIVTPPKRVVSVKLDIDTIELIDRIVQEYGYASRSEFIREAIYFYIAFLSRKGNKNKSRPVDFDESFLDKLEEVLEEALG